jgi:hypothetical protein
MEINFGIIFLQGALRNLEAASTSKNQDIRKRFDQRVGCHPEPTNKMGKSSLRNIKLYKFEMRCPLFGGDVENRTKRSGVLRVSVLRNKYNLQIRET